MANRPMSGAGGMINRAAGEMPSRQTKGKLNTGSVGSERPVSPRVVQEGGSAAEAAGTGNSLSRATGELRSQHPIDYSDHGPHHGRSDHVRHMPLHGMRPGKMR